MQAQLLAREASGEQTAILLVFVLWTFLRFLIPRINKNWRQEETIRQVVSLSVLFSGFAAQRFWIWWLLWSYMTKWPTNYEDLWWVNIWLDVWIATGAVCVIREFSPVGKGNFRAMIALGVMALFVLLTNAPLLSR